MTRDEAADTIYDLRKKASGMPTLSCGAMMGEAVFLADVLVALGVLKLDVSLSEQVEAVDGAMRRSDPFRTLSMMIQEQGLKFREVGLCHFEITSPTTGLQRDLIERYRTIGVRIDYAPAPPPRCEPPPEHQDKHWHWLKQTRSESERPMACQWLGIGWSYFAQIVTPSDGYEAGWRYVAPCLPPEEGR